MNILVTGATGKVGDRLVPRLLSRGDKVRILVRDLRRAEGLIAHGAEAVQGDLLRPETLTQAVAGADAVIHLAAFFRGATPEETQAVNLQGTLALAEAALEAKVPRLVFASTNLVYGPGHGERLFREEDPPRPAAPYPTTKADRRGGAHGASPLPRARTARCPLGFRLRGAGSAPDGGAALVSGVDSCAAHSSGASCGCRASLHAGRRTGGHRRPDL
ncbi:NAD-dependent epimerase/dehydratase family protein [Paenibacillus sp. P26]|nr:NAD-dependent epimerase/dehydratase family protein [Paenibacillus sp. P26]